MRTRAGSCYAPPAVGDVKENCKRKRQMMNRDKMNGKRLQREYAGVNNFDDLPDDVLIYVLAKSSDSAKYAAEFVNVILTCKRFNTLGLHLLVLPQEKVYQRLQTLKEMYFPEIKELFNKLQTKCQQPMQPDQSEKLKHYKTTLQRMMAYFQVQKSSIPPGFKEDKVDAFEKQIQAILKSFKQRKSAPQQQQGQQQLPSQVNNQVQSMQPQEKHVNPLQQMNLQPSVTSMESSGQTGQPTAADWQEKVYQRLQTLKEMYFPEIKELFNKLQTKCQQPMQPDQSEKLKHYKTTLQRTMAYFQVQKSSIPPGFKEDKVDAFEKQIQAILNSFKQRKSAPQQQQGQQQLPSQVNNQVQSMQPQEKHVKPLQQMNLRPSVPSMLILFQKRMSF